MKMVVTKSGTYPFALNPATSETSLLNLQENEVAEVFLLDEQALEALELEPEFNSAVKYSIAIPARNLKNAYVSEKFVKECLRPFVSAAIQVERCKNLEDVNSFLGKIPLDTYVDLKVIASGYLVIYKDLGDTVL